MWARNLFFIAFLLLAAGSLTLGFLRDDPVDHPDTHKPWRYKNEKFRAVVQQLDDAFASHWKLTKTKPAARADELTIARRLSLGLTGTIPSLEEIRAFESKPDEDRIQWWVSHLLDDDRYADYVAERLARAYVGVENGPFLVYRRRRFVTWLSDQLRKNERYDSLARQLINGRGLWTTNPNVNFLTVTINPNGDGEGPDEVKLAARLSRAFLGVRIDCSQCHDGRFDDWKQQDFHQLAAFFNNAEMSVTGVRDKKKEYEFKYLNKEETETVPTIVPFYKDLLPPEGDARTRLAQWVTHPDNKPFSRAIVNRVWALMFGKPLVSPVDDLPLDAKDLPPMIDVLADDFAKNGFDLHRLIRVIAASRVFQLDSRRLDEQVVTELDESAWSVFPMTRLRPEQVIGSVTQCATLDTIDADSHVLVKFIRLVQQQEFVKRYGDTGEDEFVERGGTIPQRLLLMNGKIVKERTEGNIVMNAAPRIALLAPSDAKAVEVAFLVTLSRRPTAEETSHFATRLSETPKGDKRAQRMQDICWSLINSTEFSWNH